MDKDSLRKEMAEIRRALPQSLAMEKNQSIANYLFSLPIFLLADRVFTYVSMGCEVDTHGLMYRLWQEKKVTSVPRVLPDAGLDFFQIDSLDNLTASHFGVLEPVGEFSLVIPRPTDVFLVPGLAFDQKGNRVGYGKGYYDRYFRRFPHCIKIGLAYDFQVVDEISSSSFDVGMDYVVTESGCFGKGVRI